MVRQEFGRLLRLSQRKEPVPSSVPSADVCRRRLADSGPPVHDVPLFAKFRLRAILEIHNMIKSEVGFWCQCCKRRHSYEEVTTLPLNSVSVYQQVGKETGP